MENKESRKGMEEVKGSSRHPKGPRGNLTNSFTRASEGQEQLRGPIRKSTRCLSSGCGGMIENNSQLNKEDHYGWKKRDSFSPPQNERKMPRMAEKIQVSWRRKKRTMKITSSSTRSREKTVEICRVMGEGRWRRA